MPTGMYGRPGTWRNGLLRYANGAYGCKGGAPFLGGAMYYRERRFWNSLFFRLYASVRVLPKLRNCSGDSREKDLSGKAYRDILGIKRARGGKYQPGDGRAFSAAKARGLEIPIVYNTSGYEKADVLQQLNGLVDIWLPDYKYRDSVLAKRLSHCADYPKRAEIALTEMVRQAGKPVFDSRGMMKKGVIVRHLVLPGCVGDSKDVLDYLHDTWGEQIWISILSQYTPLPHVRDDPHLNRRVTDAEYGEVVDYACFLGMKQVYIQEGGCAGESFIPAFDYTGV